jgi:hypothetical protein
MKAIPPKPNVPSADEPSESFHPLNPRKEPLTPDKLRELTGNSSITDEAAAGIIQTINKLTAIFLELVGHNSIYCIDNQLNVSLSQDGSPQGAAGPTINPITQNTAA